MRKLDEMVDEARANPREEGIAISLLRDPDIILRPGESGDAQSFSTFYLRAPYGGSKLLSLGTVHNSFETGEHRDDIMEQIRHQTALRLELFFPYGPMRFTSTLLNHNQTPVTKELLDSMKSARLPYEIELLKDPWVVQLMYDWQRLERRFAAFPASE